MSLVEFVLMLRLGNYQPLNGTQIPEIVQIDVIRHATLQRNQLAILIELVPHIWQVLPFGLHETIKVHGDPVLRGCLVTV